MKLHNRGVEVKTRVRYSETDQMGVVYYGNYLVWFDIAREKLIEQMGINIRKAESKGYMMPVIEVSCKYIAPAKYGDENIIRAVPEKTSVAKLIVHYQVINTRHKRLLAEGRTVNVIMNQKGKLIVKAPDEFKEFLDYLS